MCAQCGMRPHAPQSYSEFAWRGTSGILERNRIALFEVSRYVCIEGVADVRLRETLANLILTELTAVSAAGWTGPGLSLSSVDDPCEFARGNAPGRRYPVSSKTSFTSLGPVLPAPGVGNASTTLVFGRHTVSMYASLPECGVLGAILHGHIQTGHGQVKIRILRVELPIP